MRLKSLPKIRLILLLFCKNSGSTSFNAANRSVRLLFLRLVGEQNFMKFLYPTYSSCKISANEVKSMKMTSHSNASKDAVEANAHLAVGWPATRVRGSIIWLKWPTAFAFATHLPLIMLFAPMPPLKSYDWSKSAEYDIKFLFSIIWLVVPIGPIWSQVKKEFATMTRLKSIGQILIVSSNIRSYKDQVYLIQI